MELNCPNCQQHIAADDVNITKTIALCKSCDNIFNFTREMNFPEAAKPYRQVHHIPPGVEVTEFDDALEINMDWRRSRKSFTFFFTIFWNLFMFVWMSIALGTGEIAMLLFGIPFLVVGAYLAYTSFAWLINTTNIYVDEQYVAIEHRPISWLLQKDAYYAPDQVDQLYVKREQIGSVNDNPVYGFTVMMRLHDGKELKMVEHLHAESAACLIEQRIEEYLGIVNRPVAGELK